MMTTLTAERLLRSIARRLAETADREQVIEELCLLQNIDWATAATTVEAAETQFAPEITRRQTPLLVLLALAIYIGGVALAAWQLLGLVAVASAMLNPRAESFWEIYNLSFGFFDVLTNFWGILLAFVTGLAMALGSYFGMKDVYSAWLEVVEAGEIVPDEPVPALAEIPGPPLAPGAEAIYSADGWVRNHPDDPELIEFITSRLEHSHNQDWVIASLALARGLSWPVAAKLVETVAAASGMESPPEKVYDPPVVFSLLGIFLAGLVISLQYLMVSNIALRAQWLKVHDIYWLTWFIYQVGRYIENAPGPFVLFALGVTLLIGGFLALRVVGPSVVRWQSKH
jgi:hypothetical protein